SVADPHDTALPALVGSLLSWLPTAERITPRCGSFAIQAATTPASESERNCAHYLLRCWRLGARRPWRLVLDLAAAEQTSLEEPFDALTRLAAAWDQPAQLMAYLVDAGALTAEERATATRKAPAALLSANVADAGRLWNRVLHYWGRGFFGSS